MINESLPSTTHPRLAHQNRYVRNAIPSCRQQNRNANMISHCHLTISSRCHLMYRVNYINSIRVQARAEAMQAGRGVLGQWQNRNMVHGKSNEAS